MKYGNFDQNYITRYLQSHAELNSFYIFLINDIEPGLINYFDSKGETWSLMEDDNSLVDACLEYLKTTDAPVFIDVDELKAFEIKQTQGVKS